MVMTLLTRPKKTIATVIIATDGSGDFNCDGTADDGEFNAALDSLPAGGGVVYVKEGTYVIDATITLPVSNIKLVGAGTSSIISISTGIACIEVGAAIANIEIESLSFIQSGIRNGRGVDLHGVNTTIRNCYFENLSVGVYETEGSSNSIESCYFTLCTTGVSMFYGVSVSLRSLIFGNKFISNIQYGVRFLNVDDCMISGNLFYDNGWGGIAFFSACNRHTINGNIIIDNGDKGIYLRELSDRNSITGNQITGNGGWGIDIENANCDNNLVVGNVVQNNTAGQIRDLGTGTDVSHNITA